VVHVLQEYTTLHNARADPSFCSLSFMSLWSPSCFVQGLYYLMKTAEFLTSYLPFFICHLKVESFSRLWNQNVFIIIAIYNSQVSEDCMATINVKFTQLQYGLGKKPHC